MSSPGLEKVRTVSWDGDCPYCGERISFRLRTDYGTFGTKAPDADWIASLSSTEQELLAMARLNGVFDSFERTARECFPDGASFGRNSAKSFLKFLRGMRQQDLTGSAALSLRSAFPNSHTTVYTFGLMSVVIADGQMRMFFPTSRLFGKPKPPVAVAVTGADDGTLQVKEITRNMENFRDWVKTRMGYVPTEGSMFLGEMRKRCYGAFGTHEKPKGAGGAA